MSYAAEPYAQFVDDLLTALTGGVIREQFLFVPENAPFLLQPPGPVVASSLLVAGQADGAYSRFRIDRDFTLTAGNAIQWQAGTDGTTPAAGAVWPDPGTPFFVNYDHRGPSGLAPLLSDRNPGSVTRLLAESLGREYAVLSRQLEGVYRAGFLATATGRDLDQLVALLGLERRTSAAAAGTVVFSRSTPAPADVFVPAGTLLSTAEPPAVTFETSEDVTLHRGTLSAEVAVRATTAGALGVVPAGAIAVVNRPLFGIETAANPEPTALAGASESDAELRQRATRALAGSGKATVGAMLAALTSLPGVREKDIRLAEDHLKRPGVIVLSVAAPLDADDAERALGLIEASRPAGMRVIHNLDAPALLGTLTPGVNAADDDLEPPAEATSVPGPLYFPVVAAAVLLPATAALSPQQRNALKRKGEDTVRAFVADAGVGETLIYNRLVAGLMALDGVLDVTLQLYPQTVPPAAPPSATRRRNVQPSATLRPTVDPKYSGALAVEVGGQLVALDVTVTLTLKGAGTLGNRADDLEEVRQEVAGRLRDLVPALTALSADDLRAKLGGTDTWSVVTLSFTAEYVAAGVILNQPFGPGSPSLPLSDLERPWVRSVVVTEPA
ncbi:MAG TPA: baseplate J/gp47 family protein [Thermoanaerobaculia bacterium]|nr:baseplate J/gp47 family protein [Thermoanaerobaculia bacterium]